MGLREMNTYIARCHALVKAKDRYYAACSTGESDETLARLMSEVRYAREVLREGYPEFTDPEAYEAVGR